MTASADGTRVYTTDFANLHTIDTATNTVVGTLSLQGNAGGFPTGITVSPDGSTVYVTQAPGTNGPPGVVSVVDTASNSVIHTITGAGINPEDVAVNADRSRIYVSNGGGVGSDTLIRVFQGTAPYGVLGTINVPGVQCPGNNCNIRDIGISPDGTRLYVLVQQRAMLLKVIDTTVGPVGSVINTVTLGIQCCVGGVEVSPDGSTVYVGTNGAQSQPAAVDTATNVVTLITGIPAGGLPLFLAISADGNTIVTANLLTDSVSVRRFDKLDHRVTDSHWRLSARHRVDRWGCRRGGRRFGPHALAADNHPGWGLQYHLEQSESDSRG